MPTKRPREEDEQSNHDEEEVDQVVESDAEESSSPPPRDAGKSKANHASTEPAKKRRGRPPGSKNKKTLAAEAAAAGVPAAPPPPKRPRGRPRKPRTEAELEAERQKALMPKRPRGRPPKSVWSLSFESQGWMTGLVQPPPTAPAQDRPRPPPLLPLPLVLRLRRRSRADLLRNQSERGTYPTAHNATCPFPPFSCHGFPAKLSKPSFFGRPTVWATYRNITFFTPGQTKKTPPFLPLASQSSVCSPYLRLSFLLANPSYTFLTQKNGHFSPILRALLVDTMARPSFHVTSFLKAFSPDPGYPPPTCLVSSFSPSTLFVTSGLCSRCIDILYLVQSLYAHPRRSLLSFNLSSPYLVLYLRTTQPPVFPRSLTVPLSPAVILAPSFSPTRTGRDRQYVYGNELTARNLPPACFQPLMTRY